MRSGDQKEVAWEADSEAAEVTTSPGAAVAPAPVLVAPIAPATMRRPVRGSRGAVLGKSMELLSSSAAGGTSRRQENDRNATEWIKRSARN
nr:hypothetical protein GCM10020093_058290 [Planobispora longispora]